MQSELVNLVQSKYDDKLKQALEERSKTEQSKQESIKRVHGDSQKVKQIESDHQKKLDLLNKQISEYKSMERKQEMLQKKLGFQDTKVKSLTSDIEKMKVSKG